MGSKKRKADDKAEGKRGIRKSCLQFIGSKERRRVGK